MSTLAVIEQGTKARVLEEGSTTPIDYKPGGIYFDIALNENLLTQAIKDAYHDVQFVTAAKMQQVVTRRKRAGKPARQSTRKQEKKK